MALPVPCEVIFSLTLYYDSNMGWSMSRSLVSYRLVVVAITRVCGAAVVAAAAGAAVGVVTGVTGV